RVLWVDGDHELAPGVSVHLVGGHTAGMQVVRVQTANGVIVLASDATHFYENLERDQPYSIVDSVPGALDAFDRLRALAGPDGSMRTTYDGADDVLELIGGMSESELARTDFGSYTQQDFMDTLGRITEYRCDPDLAHTLTTHSKDTLRWMQSHGVRFAPSYGR